MIAAFECVTDVLAASGIRISMDALIRALWAQVQNPTTRVAD